jgi:hypothetical protein
MSPPLSADRTAWTHLTDCAPCQALADAAREAAIEVIRSESVRDPAHGANVAILSCAGFVSEQPIERQTWCIQFGATGARAICEFPDARLEFARDAFAADPRIAGLTWDRA